MDGPIKRKIEAGAPAERIQAMQRSKLITFFTENAFPVECLQPPYDDITDPDEPKRTALFDNIVEYTFQPDRRPDIELMFVVDLCKSAELTRTLVLPSPSSSECAQLITSLMAKLYSGPPCSLVNSVAYLEGELSRRHLATLVDTDETRKLSGKEKVARVLTHLAAFQSSQGISAISAPSASSTASASSGHNTSPADSTSLRLHLVTKSMVDLENRIKTAMAAGDVIQALVEASTSREPLVLRLLYTFNTLGPSDVYAQLAQLRQHLNKAASFLVTSSAHPITGVLEVDVGMEGFLMDQAYFMEFWNAKYSALDFFRLQHMITSKLNGPGAVRHHKPPPKDTAWGDVTANTAAAKLWDNLFYLKGYETGAFENIVDLLNKRLVQTASLKEEHLNIVKTDLTAAFMIALKEIAAAEKQMLQATTPGIRFPQDGSKLLPDDSRFFYALADLDKELERLRSQRKWNDKPAQATYGVDKQLQTLKDENAALTKGSIRLSPTLLSPCPTQTPGPKWHRSEHCTLIQSLLCPNT